MRKAIAGALLVLMLASLAGEACGQMFPLAAGLPNAVHASTSTAWVHDEASVFEFQDTSVMPAGCWFPAIHQTSIHTQSMSHTEFSQTSEFTAIGFPGLTAPFACGY